MTVVVASCTVAKLFSGETFEASDGTLIEGNLHLPEYQRPYRWGEAQIRRLLEDLRRYFCPPHPGSSPAHLFYLGSIILHQDGEGRLNIIDGQQRLTTMALLMWQQAPGSEPKLRYESPLSHAQIRKNQEWLKQQENWNRAWLKLERINITVVVTRSEDDAYCFFETQNTGGVRLSGPDIIKAHHLRATPRSRQDRYARLWESLGDLNPVVDAVLKARSWNALNFRHVPSRREPLSVRETVVTELAENTGEGHADVAYGLTATSRTPDGAVVQVAHADGYAMRQPLNAGINSIHYLEYFESLRRILLTNHREPDLDSFHNFYQGLIVGRQGCSYLKKLYDSCLLLYASHFGRSQLFEASLRLFRVVYAPRVTNEKTVKEATASKFVRENPVFDWILMSYTHEQCMERLRLFEVKVSAKNLGQSDDGVKKRFVQAVNEWFSLELPKDRMAEQYDDALQKAIKSTLEVVNHG
ncbi:protein of unknown function DUF262 family [Halorhodospira halochloris]|uniref:Uncharacterized protein n=1 Tax=Halorhodospira halochloris TaxID=1052 RepID=A0A0X8XB57_HALHR|nr:DUF262 domain-containing protein [Halorhodospira halochloris]MBK1651913.1 hypothetical protein [Halorhodospira halochloris]BAU58745.1 protein of unknown function DUF262 family [Halorhodospira halochloris]